MYKVYHYSVISCMFTNVESVRVRFTRLFNTNFYIFLAVLINAVFFSYALFCMVCLLQ